MVHTFFWYTKSITEDEELMNVLLDQKCSDKFKAFAAKEWSLENILFFGKSVKKMEQNENRCLNCTNTLILSHTEQYLQMTRRQFTEQEYLDACTDLYNNYLTVNATLQLNVDASITLHWKKIMTPANNMLTVANVSTTLDKTIIGVKSNMLDTLNRFKRTEFYKTWLTKRTVRKNTRLELGWEDIGVTYGDHTLISHSQGTGTADEPFGDPVETARTRATSFKGDFDDFATPHAKPTRSKSMIKPAQPATSDYHENERKKQLPQITIMTGIVPQLPSSLTTTMITHEQHQQRQSMAVKNAAVIMPPHTQQTQHTSTSSTANVNSNTNVVAAHEDEPLETMPPPPPIVVEPVNESTAQQEQQSVPQESPSQEQQLPPPPQAQLLQPSITPASSVSSPNSDQQQPLLPT